MEENKIDLVKLIMENDLNKDTIKHLMKIVTEMADNIFHHVDSGKLLEIAGNDMEILKNHYKNVIDSISKFEE